MTIDTNNGNMTPIGGSTNVISDIWFAPDGTLYGQLPDHTGPPVVNQTTNLVRNDDYGEGLGERFTVFWVIRGPSRLDRFRRSS